MSDFTTAGEHTTAKAQAPGQDATACAAHDLKHVIAALISQISDADRRQSDAIGLMQARLSELGADARSVQKRVPAEFADAFGRLEDALSGLAERLAEASVRHSEDMPSRPAEAVARHASLAQVAAAIATPVVPPVATEPTVIEESALLSDATPPPALRSAVSDPAEGRIMRSKPTQDPFEFAVDSVDGDPDNPWREQDAEALTRAYEDATGHVAPRVPATPGLATPAPVTHALAAPQPASIPHPASAIQAAVSPVMPLAAMAAAAPIAADRAWLDERFSDIAARIDAELGRLDPETALADFGRRFDVMEARFATALQDVATRADVEGIKIVEACLNDLSDQIERTQGEVARFGSLEAEVVALAGRLSEERLAALVAPQPQPALAPEIDIAGLAESISAHLGAARQQLDQQSQSRPIIVDDSRFLSSVGELKDVVDSLVQAQRSGDEQTSSMLDMMQQALIRMLDRMESIEAAQQALAEPRVAVTAAPELPPAAPREAPRAHPMAMAVGAPAPAHHDAYDVVDRHPAHAQPSSDQAAIGRLATASQEAVALARSPQPAPSSAAHAEPAAAHYAAAQQPAVPPARDRQQFIEAARRAAQAASARHTEQAAPQPTPAAASNPVAAMRRQMAASQSPAGQPAAPRVDPHEAAAQAHAEARRRAYALPGLSGATGTGDGSTHDAAPARRGFSLPGIGGAGAAPGSSSRVRLLAAVLVAVVIGFGGFKLLAGRKAQMAEPQTIERQLITPETMAREKAGEAEGGSEAAPAPESAEQPGRAPAGATTPPRRINSDGASLPAGGPTLASADQTGGADVETPFSLGIEVDNGGPRPTADELGRNRLQQHYAQWSTHVGTSQPPITGVPAALTPDVARPGAAVANTRAAAIVGEPGAAGSRHVPQTTALPPTSVGPLSLRMAAANGDASAEFAVGARLAEGKSGEQDFKQAIVWYQRAASRGFALAQYRLATLYERGLGAKTDAGRARVWYLRAAEQGNVKAMHNLAVLAAGPAGGQPDYATAATWFGEAAERGLADSQFNLAILYESGLGVTADRKAAYKWFSLAARNGDGEAAKRLEALTQKIPAPDKAVAEGEVRQWRAKPVIALANDPFVAGEAWKQGGPAKAAGG